MNKNRFSLANRLIHWAIALTISFVMLTVFLRIGWMNKNQMGQTLLASLAKINITITTEQASNIGKDIRHSMWEYHEWGGYLLIGLYVIRMIITYVQGFNFKNPLLKTTSPKEKFKSWLYISFYVLLAGTLTTGMLIEFGPKEWKHLLEEIHELTLYYVITFVVLHIGGVLISDRYEERGIISKMISGDK